MKGRRMVGGLGAGLFLLALLLVAGFAGHGEAREIPGLQQIQRGVWQETTPFKSYTTYRLLCVGGLEFLAMEGYAWGESSATSSQIIQVLDQNGKPKVCQ